MMICSIKQRFVKEFGDGRMKDTNTVFLIPYDKQEEAKKLQDTRFGVVYPKPQPTIKLNVAVKRKMQPLSCTIKFKFLTCEIFSYKPYFGAGLSIGYQF